MRIPSCWIALVFTLVAGLGCGRGSSPKQFQPPTEVEQLVYDMADSAVTPDEFKAMFAQGVEVPEADRKTYSLSGFGLEKTVMESETAATLHVVVNSPEGEEKGKVEWSAVKDGDKWKLKSAPLP